MCLVESMVYLLWASCAVWAQVERRGWSSFDLDDAFRSVDEVWGSKPKGSSEQSFHVRVRPTLCIDCRRRDVLCSPLVVLVFGFLWCRGEKACSPFRWPYPSWSSKSSSIESQSVWSSRTISRCDGDEKHSLDVISSVVVCLCNGVVEKCQRWPSIIFIEEELNRETLWTNR